MPASRPVRLVTVEPEVPPARALLLAVGLHLAQPGHLHHLGVLLRDVALDLALLHQVATDRAADLCLVAHAAAPRRLGMYGPSSSAVRAHRAGSSPPGGRPCSSAASTRSGMGSDSRSTSLRREVGSPAPGSCGYRGPGPGSPRALP